MKSFFVLILSMSSESFLGCPCGVTDPIVIQHFPTHIIATGTLKFCFRFRELAITGTEFLAMVQIDSGFCHGDVIDDFVLSGILDERFEVSELIWNSSEE